MNILTIEVILKLHRLFSSLHQSKLQIPSIDIKLKRFEAEMRRDTVLIPFHQSNFNITLIVMNMLTIEMILKIHRLSSSLYQTKLQITSIDIKLTRLKAEMRRDSVLIPFHQSNFNIT